MIKTKISKDDKVRIIRGEGRSTAVDEKGKVVLCRVLKVDRATGRAILEIPRPKAKRGEREKPVRGIEVWKTVRYNAKSGEAGGLKIVKRAIHVSNLEVVEKAPPREFPR